MTNSAVVGGMEKARTTGDLLENATDFFIKAGGTTLAELIDALCK